MLPRAPSSSPELIPNCLIKAILPSTVLFKSSKDGAKADLANASSAIVVSCADRPACARVTETCNRSADVTPRVVDSLVISLVMPDKAAMLDPVT